MSDYISIYEKALWDIYVASGADTDGDTGPGAYLDGSRKRSRQFAVMVLESVRELKRDYDDSLEESQVLENLLIEAEQRVAELQMGPDW